VRKSLIVARHEFGVTVKRVWFVLATFVFPLISLTVLVLMVLLQQRTMAETEASALAKPLGIVDLSGELRREPKFAVRRYEAEAEALKAAAQGDVASFLVVPADWIATGHVKVVTKRKATLLTANRTPLPPDLEAWLVENLLRDVEAPRRERAREPFLPRTVYLDHDGLPSGEPPMAVLQRSGQAYVFFFVLFMAIFASTQYLLQGMAEEKENRVMEMVLTSVTPNQLMVGKLLGLGGAGLLQLSCWSSMGLVATVLFSAVTGSLAPAAYAICFLFYVLGYLLYGSLMLGFASLGSNFRESQQMASLWSLIASAPAFILIALIESPQGGLARAFSFIPFTAPMTMMFRYVVDPTGTPAWEILLSAAILAGTAIVALLGSARLFRVGLLLYGKRPGVREIWRWLVRGK
jgi:ABC-2 type transport system permease protein